MKTVIYVKYCIFVKSNIHFFISFKYASSTNISTKGKRMPIQKHPFWNLALPQGKLLLTPCPGTLSTPLPAALEQLKEQGAATLITLITPHEMKEKKLDGFADAVAAAGLEWLHLPITDDDSPKDPFEENWQRALPKLEQQLNAGSAIAIHCMGGSGRTGIVAARLMLDQGVELDDAITQIQELRPKAFSFPVQREYIQQFSK